jgi:adenosylhomocysteinase
MKNFLYKSSALFYQNICGRNRYKNLQIVIVIHILPDIIPILKALKAITDIPLIIAIPYSIHISTLNLLKDKYQIITPSLRDIQNKNFLLHEITKCIDQQKKTIIFEIGGYCAHIISALKKYLGNLLLGVIEDTESGHRKYEKLETENGLPCPVISVARSVLKEPENFMVGATCLHVVEKLIRNVGYPIQGRHSLVIGYGKIGRGMAYALRQYHSPVYVYDIDPIKNILALSEGFQVLDRRTSFDKAEIIYGTTGNCSITKEDFPLLKSVVTLVSCSSKQIEFDVASLKTLYKKHIVVEGIDLYNNGRKKIYLLADGMPVNFINGAVTLGPLLNLPLGEMTFAIKKLFVTNYPKKMVDISFQEKRVIAAMWLKYFRNLNKGNYKCG